MRFFLAIPDTFRHVRYATRLTAFLNLSTGTSYAVEIAAGQQLGLTLFEPDLRLFSMTFRTGPVATAVETPERLATVVALIQFPAQFLGATGFAAHLN